MLSGLLSKQASLGFASTDGSFTVSKTNNTSDPSLTEMVSDKYTVPAGGTSTINFGNITTGKILWLKNAIPGISLVINGSVILPISGFVMMELTISTLDIVNATAAPVIVDVTIFGV